MLSGMGNLLLISFGCIMTGTIFDELGLSKAAMIIETSGVAYVGFIALKNAVELATKISGI